MENVTISLSKEDAEWFSEKLNLNLDTVMADKELKNIFDELNAISGGLRTEMILSFDTAEKVLNLITKASNSYNILEKETLKKLSQIKDQLFINDIPEIEDIRKTLESDKSHCKNILEIFYNALAKNKTL